MTASMQEQMSRCKLSAISHMLCTIPYTLVKGELWSEACEMKSKTRLDTVTGTNAASET